VSRPGTGRRIDVRRAQVYEGPSDPDPFASRVIDGWDAINGAIVTRDGAVETWPDSYAGALTLLQATSGNRPTHDSTDADFGPRGQSVAFDGTDDYVASAGSASSVATCTWGLIFRTGAIGTLRTIVSMGTNALSGGMDIRVTAGGNLICVSWDGVNAQSGKFFAVAANTVYRLIAVWNPVVGTYAWTLYNAGVATGTDNGAVVNTPSNQTGIMRIGQNSTLAQPSNHKVRLVKRYLGTLTAGEAATLDAYYASLLT
jgi:hypothetical protein